MRTVSDLQNALGTPNDTMIFVESIMHPHDAPAAVIISSNKGAELDYGPRGPQSRQNVQLRPTMQEGGAGLLHSATREESNDHGVLTSQGARAGIAFTQDGQMLRR